MSVLDNPRPMPRPVRPRPDILLELEDGRTFRLPASTLVRIRPAWGDDAWLLRSAQVLHAGQDMRIEGTSLNAGGWRGPALPGHPAPVEGRVKSVQRVPHKES